mgnify:CR=1 FL=1
MPCDVDFAQRFELLQSGLVIVAELEERSYLAQAGQKISTSEFDRRFFKTMGLASSVAVSYGQDDLAEDALKLGGDEV